MAATFGASLFQSLPGAQNDTILTMEDDENDDLNQEMQVQKETQKPMGGVIYTLKIDMEPKVMEVWKIIFLSNWVICGFHVHPGKLTWLTEPLFQPGAAI